MSREPSDPGRRAVALAGLVPELAPPFAATSPVRVPELCNVALTRRVLELIDHPDFQRLRRVRQLGPAHLIYPGATHTRFEHSLGVFDKVRRYLTSLLLDADFVAAVSERDLLTGLAAGLLHDLGHYPFAHALEALGRKGLQTPDHEAVGGRILTGLLSAAPIGHLLESGWGVDPERVARIVASGPAGQAEPVDAMLASILHSPIDADKMDYLERDSIHLGVPYGRNYDRDRLLSCLAVDPGTGRLAVTDKGKVSAEVFVFCRYTMFSEVYWHHAVRAIEAMLERALEDFCERARLSEDALVTELLAHSDESLVADIRARSPEDSPAGRLCAALSGGRRRLYKRVLSLSRAHQRPAFQSAYERVVGLDRAGARRLEASLTERLSGLLGRALDPAEVILDFSPPGKHRLEDLQVLFAHKRSSASLADLSHTVRGIGQDFARRVDKARVFVAPEAATEARAKAGREELAGMLLNEILALPAADEGAKAQTGRLL